MIRYIFIFLFVVSGCVVVANNCDKETEKVISKEELLPIYRLKPYPSSGVVLFNAPSFICKPAIAEQRGKNTFHFDYSYQYQFRISKDPEFKDKTTLVSPVQDWTFFNTHKALEKGKWFWQYAYVKGGKKKWHKPIAFKVSGNESNFVSPSFSELKKKIKPVHPRILTTPDLVGKVDLPKDMVDDMKRRIDPKIDKELPTLIFENKEVMRKKKQELNKEQYELYMTKRTRDNCKSYSKETSEVVMLYLLSGDKKYLNEALKRYRHFSKVYKEIIEIGQWLDFTEVAYHSVMVEVFDAAYDYLSDDEKKDIIHELSESQEKSFRKYLHKPAHELHSSHFWQIELRNFMLNSLVLIGHTDKADKWLNYIYDLYIVRAPTGSWNDGGWAPGNKYFSANQETLFIVPFILSRITGFNYFSKPWYQNVSEYLMYTSPIGHPTGSFGDGTDYGRENMLPLVRALNKVQNNCFGDFYEKLHKKIGTEDSNLPRLAWYTHQPLNLEDKDNICSSGFSLAKDFRDVGNVAMHTNLRKPKENMYVAFRSSPYGVVGHSHAAQNSFSIFYGGEPLIYHTGYYTNWADFHTLQSYRHTRAHNSVLIDGMGQNFHSSGYGWIPQFVTGDVISYASGDASRAYSGTIARDEIERQMKKHGIKPTKEFGFGNPGLQKFKRHIFMLRPGIVVVYDELEANKPVEFSWLNNARCSAKLIDKNILQLNSDKGKATVELFCSTGFNSTLSDEFVAPPVDWQGKGGKKVKLNETSYHFRANTEKVKKARFLAIIQVGDKVVQPLTIKKNKDGFQVGDWIIKAELDENQPAAFQCTNKKDALISMGNKEVGFLGKKFSPDNERATLLIEKKNGEFITREIVDELPKAAMYY